MQVTTKKKKHGFKKNSSVAQQCDKVVSKFNVSSAFKQRDLEIEYFF